MMITDMRPEIAAALLSSVEEKWSKETVALLTHTTKKLEKDVESEVVSSCAKIANSIVKGSDGDRDKVADYMQDVCAATKKADKELCQKFEDGILDYMSNDVEFNRDTLDTSKFCTKFYEGTVVEQAKGEQKRLEEEEKKRQEGAKKQAEEAAKKKAEEEKAAAEKKQQEMLKAKEDLSAEAKEEEKAAEEAEEVAEKFSAANAGDATLEKEKLEVEQKEVESLKEKARKELAAAEAEEEAQQKEQEAPKKKASK